LNPGFRTPDEVIAYLGTPVLASLPWCALAGLSFARLHPELAKDLACRDRQRGCSGACNIFGTQRSSGWRRRRRNCPELPASCGRTVGI